MLFIDNDIKYIRYDNFMLFLPRHNCFHKKIVIFANCYMLRKTYISLLVLAVSAMLTAFVVPHHHHADGGLCTHHDTEQSTPEGGHEARCVGESIFTHLRDDEAGCACVGVLHDYAHALCAVLAPAISIEFSEPHEAEPAPRAGDTPVQSSDYQPFRALRAPPGIEL